MLQSMFEVALLQLRGRLAGKGAHHGAEDDPDTWIHPVLQKASLRATKYWPARAEPLLLAALGEHVTAAMFINLPYLQKHLYWGQHLHQSLPLQHHKEVTEWGGGERESLAWSKGGKTDKEIAWNRCGEKNCHLILPYVTFILQHFSRNKETKETK